MVKLGGQPDWLNAGQPDFVSNLPDYLIMLLSKEVLRIFTLMLLLANLVYTK